LLFSISLFFFLKFLKISFFLKIKNKKNLKKKIKKIKIKNIKMEFDLNYPPPSDSPKLFLQNLELNDHNLLLCVYFYKFFNIQMVYSASASHFNLNGLSKDELRKKIQQRHRTLKRQIEIPTTIMEEFSEL